MILWIFYLHILYNITLKYVLRPPARLFSGFTSLINFDVFAFLHNYFELLNMFRAKLYLIKALSCPRYCFVHIHLSLFLRSWVNFFNLVGYSARDCLESCVGLCTNFVEILKLLISFLVDLEFHFLLVITEKFQFNLRESVCCDLQYIIHLSYWQACVWYPYFRG